MPKTRACADGDDCERRNPMHRKAFHAGRPVEPHHDALPEPHHDALPSRSARGRALAAKKEEKAAKSKEMDGEWVNVDGSVLILPRKGPLPRDAPAILAFDLDSTLIVPKSGRVFGQHREDWRWFSDNVVPTLQQLHKQGTDLVIMSNQSGINGKNGWDSSKASMICGKIADVIRAAGVPILAMVACSDDINRKPSPGMWTMMINAYYDGVSVNPQDCAYVGDAAGRAAGWKAGKKKDFSCSDRKFAYNAGIAFHTPEAFFDKEPEAPFDWGAIDPTSLPIATGAPPLYAAGAQELILFVGFPGSGKTTFAKTHLVPHGYEWVNRDTLKTAAKCKTAVKAALQAGKSAVVDNTNPTAKARADFVQIAEALGVPVRCFRFTASRSLAEHLNMYREQITQGEHRHVPQIAYNIYNKNFEEPELSEGFKEITLIDFERKKDMSEEELARFLHYY